MISHANRSGWIASVMMALAVAVAMSVPATAQDDDQGSKKEGEFVLKTPSMALGVSNTPDFAKLGLPLYPGAKYVEDKNDNGLDFGLKISGKVDVRLVVARFRTPDSLEQVRGFYQKKIGKEVTKFTPKDEDGTMIFEVRHPKDQRFVGLKAVDGKTEIRLVRMQGIDEKGSDD